MMRKLFSKIALAVAVLGVQVAVAQPAIKFKTESHDFGEITEGTQAVYEFEFTNTGNQPLILSSVNASCGCTTPSWTKEPIMPGKKGSIKASYNSSGRPGTFNKTITVNSNIGTPSMLSIKGMVAGKDARPTYTAEQLKTSPKLELAKNTFALGKLEGGQVAVSHLTVKNTGASTLEINNVQSACNCVTYTISDKAIKVGESATIELKYTAPRNKGEVSETVYIYSNDLNSPSTKVTLKASLTDSFASQGGLMRENKMAVPFK